MRRWTIGIISLAAVVLFFGAGISAKAETHQGGSDHCLCAGHSDDIDARAEHGHTAVAWEEWTSATTLPTSGSYYLGTDVTVTAITILPENGKLNLCLNGHTVSATIPTSGTQWRIFGLQAGSVLNITDCSAGSGKIVATGGDVTSGNARGFIFCNTNASGTHASNTGKVNLYNGTLDASGCTSYMGSVAYVYGVFNQFNGTVICGKGVYGGGLNVNGGTYNLYGGKLTSGKAVFRSGTSYADGGNLFVQSTGKANLLGGSIENGTSEFRGGNIFKEGSGSITIDGTTITGGRIVKGSSTSKGFGGNLAATNGTITMKSGTVSDGWVPTGIGSSAVGGNMYIISSAVFTMTGGTISGGSAANGASAWGGNLYFSTSTTNKISGGTVDGGSCSFRGGNIYLDNSTTVLEISGGTISGGKIENGGTSYTRGGNIAVGSGTLRISGGTITGGQVLVGSWPTGGNIAVQGDNSKFEMTGGTVENGVAGQGGNIMIYSAKGIVISGGTIKGGVAQASSGGNILAHQGVTLTIKGTAQILNGTAAYIGGNIAVGSESSGGVASTLTIGEDGADNSGILISGGRAGITKIGDSETSTGGYGGNIGVGENAGTIENKLYMYGGTVSNGTAVPKSADERGFGGNISVNEHGYAEILGGIITGGTARIGMNLSSDGHSSLTIAGGTVSAPVSSASGDKANVFINITGKSVDDRTLFTMTGGEVLNDSAFIGIQINGNLAEYYNAHAVISGGTVIVEGGTAIRIGGTLEITGGYIQGAVLAKQNVQNALEDVSVEISGGNYSLQPDRGLLKAGYGTFTTLDPVYVYRVEAGGFVETSSMAENGDIFGVGALSGGGAYRVSEVITLSAPEVPGYTFLRWEEGKTTLGTTRELNVEMTSTDDRYFTALYRFGGANGFTVTINVSDASTVTVAGTSQGTGYAAGTEVTVTYTGAGTFDSWVNDSGKLVSRDAAYTFVIATDTVLTPRVTSETDRAVTFYNAFNQIIKTVALDAVTDADLAAPTALAGKTNGRWVMKGQTVASKADVLAAAGTETMLTVAAVYDTDDTQRYTLTVTGKCLDETPQDYADGTVVYQDIQVGEVVQLEQPAAATKSFLYYESKSGERLSMSPNASVRFWADTEIYAVYSSAVDIWQPSVAILTLKKDGTTVNAEVIRDIPNNFELIEQGILFTTDAKLGGLVPEDAMVFNGTNTYRYVSNGQARSDVTGLVLNNVTFKVYVRGYAVYSNGSTKAIKYSEVGSIE